MDGLDVEYDREGGEVTVSAMSDEEAQLWLEEVWGHKGTSLGAKILATVLALESTGRQDRFLAWAAEEGLPRPIKGVAMCVGSFALGSPGGTCRLTTADVTRMTGLGHGTVKNILAELGKRGRVLKRGPGVLEAVAPE